MNATSHFSKNVLSKEEHMFKMIISAVFALSLSSFAFADEAAPAAPAADAAAPKAEAPVKAEKAAKHEKAEGKHAKKHSKKSTEEKAN
jgi:hypothetical protein